MKRKVILSFFVFQFLDPKPEEKPWLRLIVTRQIKRAVDRNRVKRIVREFIRQKRILLPEKLMVCRILPKAAGITNANLFKELNRLLPLVSIAIACFAFWQAMPL